MPEIPSTTGEASPEFLTRALRSGGFIRSDTSVAEIEHEPIGIGVGIVGQVARLNLRYRGDARDAPSSVVIKLPSNLPENRAIGDHFKFYEREGRFYREIAGKMPVRVPLCYWNHVDPKTNSFALVFEDMSGRISISQIAGASPYRASQALGAIAGLHAAWWNSPTLDILDWMPRLDDPINLAAGEQYRQSWPRFVELFGDGLPPGSLALGERIQAVFEELLTIAMTEAPTTICHGDFRLDNLLFDDEADEDQVAVLDWQISYRGPAISDVGYFLCQSLDVETRRAHEAALVREWYDTLVVHRGGEHGDELDGYPFDLVWEQYRRCTLATTVYPVAAGGSMDPANDRGRELIAVMAQRVFSTVIQLGAEGLLS